MANRVRPLTLRDSGIDGSMMFARDIDFRVTGEIGFQIEKMASSLVSARAGGPVMFDHSRSVTNVVFYASGRIGFHLRSLDAQMVPKHLGQPVDLDDPTQYDVRIIGGEVVEPWPATAALVNDDLLD